MQGNNTQNVVKTVRCKDVFDLVRRILSLKEYIYRGEASTQYKLVPSALRYAGRKKIKDIAVGFCCETPEYAFFADEVSAIFAFYQKANRHGLVVPHIKELYTGNVMDCISKHIVVNSLNRIRPEYFEVMALAQHYGIPTRFLDWSYNFPTALFFAAHDALKKECKREQEYKKEYDKYIEDSIVIWALNKRAFEMEHNGFKLVFVTPPYYYNENLKAQEGLFSYLDREVQIINQNKEGEKYCDYYIRSLDQEIKMSIHSGSTFFNEILLYKFTLSYSKLPQVYNYLEYNNYTYSRLFPGYANIVQELHEEKEFERLINRRAEKEQEMKRLQER